CNSGAGSVIATRSTPKRGCLARRPPWPRCRRRPPGRPMG
ncbi:MAG: hypothetical protein AVDCRST_MAG59-2367, partial [uncultured Thermomicrobiales bacterium]